MFFRKFKYPLSSDNMHIESLSQYEIGVNQKPGAIKGVAIGRRLDQNDRMGSE